MLTKEDAQMVGLGVAANLLAMQTLVGLVRLKVISFEEAMEIIAKTLVDLSTISGAAKNPEVAASALNYLQRARMTLSTARSGPTQ